MLKKYITKKNNSIDLIPILILQDAVLFPNTIMPIFVGKEKSLNAIDFATKENKYLYVSSKKDDVEENHTYNFGVIAKITQSIILPDGTLKVVLDSISRAKLIKIEKQNQLDLAQIESYEDLDYKSFSDEIKLKIKTSVKLILKNVEEYVFHNSNKISFEFIKNLVELSNPYIFSDILSSYLSISKEKKQTILETFDILERLELLLKIINEENQTFAMEQEIKNKVKSSIDKNQKEYYIHEQIRMLKKELGDHESNSDIASQYEQKLKLKNLPIEAEKKTMEEIKRLKSLPFGSAETGIIRTYIDNILDLPWNEKATIINNIQKIKNSFEESHYGMEKVKERIIEEIAVSIKTHHAKKTIICLYGPPGVGKTTLAKSIANAIGRPYVKIALGGIKDEAEIRGHRRTYIGSMPGKIISAMKKAKVVNPLILLDEIDKIGSDGRGDCSAALLEVLDKEQNNIFNDHYLELDYDLSNVMFITTANSLNIPRPLLDRLEIINVPSYLTQEKISITKKYLIPKKLQENGSNEKEIKFDDNVIEHIITHYTKESGVRELDRQIDKIIRKVILENLENKKKNKKTNIALENIEKYLGVIRFKNENIEEKDFIGVINGLAYTEVGGDILLIEAVKVISNSDKGELKYTGKLGDVMKESIQIAYSFVLSNAVEFGLNVKEIKKYDIHLHVPDGATPKDGPSAGIAITTCLISLFLNKNISRKIGMTGEISLRGKVLPIGGLREKLTAAVRSGIEKVILPEENKQNITEIPTYITDKLEIIYAERYEDVFDNVF